METRGYEGGIGGKLRRQRPALRRAAAATPYDRPASAARGGRAPPPVPAAAGAGGWLAKIVDPASRFITSSASRLFTSVFRRQQLPALPPVAEAQGETSGSGPELAEAVSSEPSAELRKNNDSENNVTNNPDNDLVLEFQQLLKQKTITRAQFEHLTNILQSRTIGLDMPKPAVNVEKLEDVNIPLPEKETESSRQLEDPVTPANILAIADDQVASPVELAKAYMGSMVSKVSPSSLSWQSHLFHENKNVLSNLNAVKQYDMRGPRSVQFSGYAETPESSYVTPRYQGRSAMYRMAYSPYFKGEGSSKDGYVGSMSLQKPSTRQSGGREVLKRRGSVLDNDFRSVGPIRRIRQKVIAASSKKVMHSVPPGNICPSPFVSTKKEIQGHSSWNERPLYLDVAEETGVHRVSNSAVVPVLPQSTDMGNKILQQLDKLVPSPKEKLPKLKDNLLDGSPSNKVLGFSKGINNSSSHKQERVEIHEENGPSTSISAVKSGSAANYVHGNFGFSNSIISSNQKPAFKMSEPEVTIMSKTNMMDPSSQLKHKDEVKLPHDESVEPSKITEGFPLTVSACIPVSSSIFSKGADAKLSGDSTAENGKGFTFPSVVSCAISQPPPTPTMPSPSVEKSVMQKGQDTTPLFNFGSKDTERMKFTSATTSSSSHAMSSLGNGISNATTSAILKSSGSDKGEDKSVSNPPIVFSFGASHNESLPNGSPILSSPSSSSAAQVTVLSGGTNSNTFSTTTAVLASSSGTTSTPPLAESNAGKLEENPSKPLLFSLNSASSDKSAVFKFGGNSSSAPIAASQFSGANSGSVLAATTVTSIGSSSTANASSNLFTSAEGKQSTFAPPSPSSGASNSIFNFGSTKTSNFGSPAVVNSTKTSPSAAAAGFFGTQSTQGESGTSQFSQSLASQVHSSHSSPTFGMHASSPSSLSSSQFGTATTDSKLFISSSIPSFSVGVGVSTISAPSFAAATTTATTTTTMATTNSNIFGSSFQPSTSPSSVSFSSSALSPATGFSFGAATSTAGSFGSSTSSPATVLAFGASSTDTGSTPFMFGSSPPAFSLNSAGATTSTISPGFPTVGSLNSAAGLNSGSPGNDQMTTEDSMAEDTNQSAGNMVPLFGQPGTPSASLVFGAPASQPASLIFPFSGQQNPSSNSSPFQASTNQQNPSNPSNQSLFQASAGQELPQGGSFSLGSGGGENSRRRKFKARRDLRKK